jgi:1-acyl-sn-glycerol-3-phosphate acyltransferase
VVGAAAFATLHPYLAALGRGLYTAWAGAVGLAVIGALGLAAWVLPLGLLRRVTRAGAWVLVRFNVRRIEVEGTENLPRDRPVLIACNHTSYLDVIPLIAFLPVDFLFVAKQEIRAWPVIGRLVRRLGHLTVDRLDSQQGVSDTARVREALQAGHSILFFPEGTFAWTAGLRPFRLGAFKVAAEAGVPIVPVALHGLRGMMRHHQIVLRPGSVRLTVAPPVAPQGSDWRDLVALRDTVAEAIAARCGEPRLDMVASGLAGLPPE